MKKIPLILLLIFSIVVCNTFGQSQTNKEDLSDIFADTLLIDRYLMTSTQTDGFRNCQNLEL
ncbi:MAG: hypothetical protein LBB41_04995, partial [Prevotellaceae bacterium]|nr:hypothetical protein [Prevotellaceae bacterium]